MRRRLFVYGATMILSLILGCSSKDEKTLVVVSFGGDWQLAQRRAFFEPFSKKTGVKIIEREYSGDYSLIREKSLSGEWDVIDVEPAELLRGAAEKIYSPIDYSSINRDQLVQNAAHEYGLGLMTYGIVVGYDTRRLDDQPAHGWKDFWDVVKYPGKRGLHNSPQWMLEAALLADGVTSDSLYPLDIDRAFQSLDRLKGNVVVFDAWSQPADLIERQNVIMSAGTNGRLQSAARRGAPIEVSWDGAIISSDFFVISVGSKNQDIAQQLVAYSVSIEAQRAIPTYINYGPSNSAALSQVPESLSTTLPSFPANLQKAVFFDAQWWFDHKLEAIDRYNEWLLQQGS